ncbi:MAG: NAD(P)H-hydrate dehydratase [Elusimicrobiota bacterium]
MKKELLLKDLRSILPVRRADAHKGDFGHALIVAGSRGMSGAAGLCGRAALRSGAGLVTLALPESARIPAVGCAPEAMTLSLEESSQGMLRTESVAKVLAAHKARDFNALAVGPGLGAHSDVGRAVVSLLAGLRIPAVVDADALNALSQLPVDQVRALLERRQSPCVLTPHPGEAARLLRSTAQEVQSDRRAAAAEIARKFGVLCLLKGHRTLVTDGEHVWTNSTGNPGLAKGGSGDALTGLIAGLLAQLCAKDPSPEPLEVLKAAALGAHLHGLAADIAVREKGERGLLASDVIETFPQAFRKTGL